MVFVLWWCLAIICAIKTIICTNVNLYIYMYIYINAFFMSPGINELTSLHCYRYWRGDGIILLGYIYIYIIYTYTYIYISMRI